MPSCGLLCRFCRKDFFKEVWVITLSGLSLALFNCFFIVPEFCIWNKLYYIIFYFTCTGTWDSTWNMMNLQELVFFLSRDGLTGSTAYRGHCTVYSVHWTPLALLRQLDEDIPLFSLSSQNYLFTLEFSMIFPIKYKLLLLSPTNFPKFPLIGW